MKFFPANRIFQLALALVCAIWAFSIGAQAAEPSANLSGLRERTTELWRAGSYEQALESAKQALTLTVQEFGAGHEQIAFQAYSVAMLADLTGNLSEAEKYFKQSLQIYENLSEAKDAFILMPLEPLGHVILRAGRPAEAEPIFERALALRQKVFRGRIVDIGAHAALQAGLGAVRLARGELANSLAYYREAVTLLGGDSKPTSDELIIREVVGSVIKANIKRDRDVYIGFGHAAWALRQQQGSNADAAALMEETYSAGQRASATSAASALAKMTARLKAGDTELGRLARGLETPTARIVALQDENLKAFADWSAVQRRDADYSKMLAAYNDAGIAERKANEPLVKQSLALLERERDLWLRCPSTENKPGCETIAREHQAIDRERAALSVAMSKNAEKTRALAKRLQAADEALPGYEESKTRRTAQLAEIQRLKTQLAADRASLAKSFPQYFALAEPRPLTVVQTQALLNSDEALVAILVGATKSFAWAVTRERADWAEIEAGEDVLGPHVAALRRGLDPLAPDAPSPSGVPEITRSFDLARSHALYKLLLERFAPMLSDKRHLLLVPTGALSSLPFQVLVTEPPRGAGSGEEAQKGAAWLIRRHALSVLPSVQSLSALRQLMSSGGAPKPFFGIGDPVLVGPAALNKQKRDAKQPVIERAAFYRNGLADIGALRELVPLPETADELRAVAKSLGAPPEAISLREDATETRVKTAKLSDYRVIHFATHGLVAGDLDGLSEPALVLTPPLVATETDDGLLTASEIATLRLNAEWVVLSACNTAAGDRVGADALSGLARAFFFSGARAILVSHWAVYSQAAVHLTTQTFATLAHMPETGRAEAFRRSMLALIDQGAPPSFWAPFVVVGEGAAFPTDPAPR